MRTIAILNQKGGTAKTTTAVSLSACLAENGKTVLLIDLDPQASASAWFGISLTSREEGVVTLFLGSTKVSPVRTTPVPGVEIIPSSSWLNGIDKMMASEIGPETILNRYLSKTTTRWDYVIMDCPPNIGLMTVNALAAARELIVPVEANIMSLSGLAQLLNTIELAKDRLNTALQLRGILICRANTRTRHTREVIDDLRSRFADTVFQTIIRENVKIMESFSFQKPISLFDPTSIGAADYRAFAAEVMAQEGSQS